MLHAIVHPADIQDRDGGILVMATLFGMFPFLKTLFADGGYQGPQFAKAIARVLPHLDVEIVKRSDRVKGFVVLPKRWIVERTIAWLNRCRRLAKDWETSTARRSRSCDSHQSASCSENYAINPEVSGRTLRLILLKNGRQFYLSGCWDRPIDRLFDNWQVDDGREHAEQYRQPPNDVIRPSSFKQ